MACSGVSRAIGGSTPNASAVRNNDVGGCPATPGRSALSIYSIGYAARVFSVILGGIEIQRSRHRVQHHVLQHRAEADRVPDLRLALARQADALRVAAAFEIEHAVFAPAVLVVADQAPVRIRRKRRLARAGQPEEQRHVAPRAHRWPSNAWAARRARATGSSES